jgi:hypothetical protein
LFSKIKPQQTKATTVDFINIINSFERISDLGLTVGMPQENYVTNKKDLENRFEEFQLCCEWIEKNRFIPTEKQFRKYVQVQTYSSYYLKHLVEKWSEKYIPNGVFIAAVKYLKIPFRPIYGTPDVSVTIFLKEKATII